MKRTVMILALALGVSGCTAAQAAIAAPRVRDAAALGTRVGCRLADRGSRATGGPWVVPRTDDERAEDARMGLFGEFSGGEADAGTPDAGAE